MTIDIEKLKAAALAATPGPWRLVERPAYNEICVTHPDNRKGAASLNVARVTVREGWKDQQTANAELIALCHPAAILDLLAQLDAAKKSAARWRDCAGVQS